ncbi:MAG: AMP-binding protein [Pseudomonadota bacterium]|nr:AMP-binding protein [Pseudomonadota bacterium]
MSRITDSPTNFEIALRALRRWPDRVAFDGHGGRFTRAACLDLIGRAQAAMTRLGMRKGDSLAVLHANRGDAWIAGMAAAGLGLRQTPLHPMGSLADHLFVLEDAEVDHLLIDAEAFGARGAELVAGCARLRAVLTLGPADYGRAFLEEAEDVGAHAPADVCAPEDIAWLAYTGGTTGRPKGAFRDHRSWSALTLAVHSAFEWPDRPAYLAVAPNSHVGGTKVLPALMRGGRVHCQHGFDPARVLDAIARERINTALMVPTMIYGLLDHPDLPRTDLSSLELLLYGASPMSPTRLREGLERVGPVFSQLYGQTEGYPISVLRKDEHDPAEPELFAAAGRPIPQVSAALLDEDDRPVAPGEVGEICVRAAHVMRGYWKRGPETEAALSGGWLHTGDMARADDRGFLFIVDRKKDMIISGGFNIYPREIEDVLTADPTVAAAAVIGVPDPKWGEAVKAVVVPRPGARPEPAALIAAVRAAKGAAHAPKSVDIVDAIPVTVIGKPDKKALRAGYWREAERQVG